MYIHTYICDVLYSMCCFIKEEAEVRQDSAKERAMKPEHTNATNNTTNDDNDMTKQ